MIKIRLRNLKNDFKKLNIDGYVIPKNDEFFSEYSKKDRLKIISNFSGSAGFAVILKNKNFLFVDGRYTIQAQIESGENFKIIEYQKIINCDLFRNLTLGIDPNLFTSSQIKRFFLKNNKIKEINENLIDKISINRKNTSEPFYSLSKSVVGENYENKINKIRNILKENNSNYIFISAPENVAWLLNIRGFDNPNSPIPNCHLFLDNKKNFFLIGEKKKIKNLHKEKKIKFNQVIEPKDFKKFIDKKMGKKIMIDIKTCSIFYENILKRKFKILKKEDPIYLLKSIKNKTEIKNIEKAHLDDGVALTKFLFWLKNNFKRKKVSEISAQNKLEDFRKLNSNYKFPSFSTISGSGPNSAIIHYKATIKSNRVLKKGDLYLVDSGGQYHYGTTDVTRTVSLENKSRNIKNIYTRVLKGHIAVSNFKIKKNTTGSIVDKNARKFLRKIRLDYPHGTGHGVGYFLNVHEGPHSLSKKNKIYLKNGMILSNEPGYYREGSFGIRIENLIYIKKNKFKELTMAPIDKDLIDKKILNSSEILWLNNYHKLVKKCLNKFMNKSEKIQLAKACSPI